jgi:1-deoxy-D-xylulose 5-phosphate reductoisomerase
MKKNIVILGSNNDLGNEALDFFLNNSNKFIIFGLSYDSKIDNLDLFITQVNRVKPKRIFLSEKKDINYIESKVKVDIFSGAENFSNFIKSNQIDEVVSSLSGIISVKKILSAIYEFKDITLLNTSPLLYSGKIIVNEAKSKGIKLKLFSYPIYSLDFLLKSNPVNKINTINLFSQKVTSKAISINEHTNYVSYLKKFYSLNKIRLVNDLFLINYIYNIHPNSFLFYEQTDRFANIDVNFINGTSVIFAANLNLESIFNYYFLNSGMKLKSDIFNKQKKFSISFSKIDLSKEKFLELGLYAIEKGGSYPIVYYIAIETILNLIYNRKLKENVKIYDLLKKIIDDKSLFDKYPDLSSVCAIEQKIKSNLEYYYIK